MNFQIRQNILENIPNYGSSDGPAVINAHRLVDGNECDHLGIVCRREADKGGNIFFQASGKLFRGGGCPADPEAGNRRLLPASLRDNLLYVVNLKPWLYPAGNPLVGYPDCDGSPTKTVLLNLYRSGQGEEYWQYSFGFRPDEELYDLSKDMDCMENLAGKPAYELVRRELRQELSDIKHLVLDFSQLDYLSSAGLRVILSAQKVMNQQGEMIVRNVSDMIMEIFEVTGFSEILTIEGVDFERE